jgi:CelD/BcsL family acetyltransferase involved in cellulose biosynthesis
MWEMIGIRNCSDPEACRALWETLWPRECLFDLWPVRACFFRHFPHSPAFFVAEEEGRPSGLLALSRIEEQGIYVQFPGETWKGRTWLEQNRIPASRPSVAAALLEHCPGPLSLRYLTFESLPPLSPRAEPLSDETDYLFIPDRYGCDFENYWGGFPGKTRRQWEREIGRLEAMGVTWRLDCFSDLETLLSLNLRSFGEDSYFRDPRFLRAFEALADWLRSRGMARLTTILVGGRVAAVDFGGLYGDRCTILAGGTDREFPGIAKLINLHHIRRACGERLKSLDFLCGDFGWKERFRLTPRPLFRVDTRGAEIFPEPRTGAGIGSGAGPLRAAAQGPDFPCPCP